MKHFPFGSSTAHRTDNCQAWRAQSEGIPRKESSYAVDGTIVHGLLEYYALGEPQPDIVEGHKVTQPHRDTALTLWQATEAFLERNQVTEWEPEVTASTAPDVGGTIDFVGLGTTEVMEFAVLLDFKTGMGVQVDPENNAQLLFAAANILYGDSTAKDMVEHVDHFLGVIVQPNRAGEVEIREWAFGREEIDAFWSQHKLNIAVARAGGDSPPKAGSWCKFCPAEAICPAKNGQALRALQLDPSDVATLGEAMDMVEDLKQWITAVEKMAYEQLEVGVDVPGWKLVMGRAGATAWDDPKAALTKLKRMLRGCKDTDGNRLAAQLEVKKMVTPTQARKILKQGEVATEFMDDITHRPPATKLTLAPESDKREAVLSATALAEALNSIS